VHVDFAGRTKAGLVEVNPSGNSPAGTASTRRARDVSRWTIAALFALSLLFQVPILDRWFNFMDEGHMVQFAQMAANGQQFYRDMTFYPLPGAFWLLALIFEIFEPSVILTRWVVALEFSAFVTLLYVLLRRIVSAPVAAVGFAGMLLYRIWAFPHWQIYSYSTTCLLLIVVCLLLLLRFFDTGERRRLGLAGFVFGLAVLAKQDYSAAFMLAAVPLLFVWNGTAPEERRLRPGALVGWFFGPAAVVGAATGLYFLAHGILPDLLRFTVFNHFTGMSTYEYTAFPSFFPVAHGVTEADPDTWLQWLQDPRLRTRLAIADYMPGIVFTTDWDVIRGHPLFLNTPLYDVFIKLYYYTPPIVILVALASLWRRRSALRAPLDDPARSAFLAECGLVGVGAGLLLLVWSNKPQDYLHLAVLYWPLILLVVVHASRLARRRRKLATGLALVLALPALVGLVYSARLVLQLRATHDTWVDVERAGYYVQPYEAVMLEDLVAYVLERTEPGDRMAALPYFPILNFLTERDGPHRSAYILWPFPEIDDRDAQVIEAMEATHTDVVVWHFTQFDSFPPVWEYAPELFDYLVDHFVIDRVFSYDAWRYKLAGLRREDPSAEERRGTLVVEPDQSNLSLSVEGAGPPVPVAPEERDDFLQRTVWPFRRVLSLRPTAQGERTVMRVDHRVADAGESLSSAVSVHPQWWFKMPPSWIDFELWVEDDAGERTLLFEQRLDPTLDLSDRRWVEFEVDLSPWAGRSIALLFVNAAERTRGESLMMAGWWEPRVRALDAAEPPAQAAASSDPSPPDEPAPATAPAAGDPVTLELSDP
jgi:hypothetical protein